MINNFFKMILLMVTTSLFAYQQRDDLSYPRTLDRLASPADVHVDGQQAPTVTAPAPDLPGQAVYKKYCNVCHGYGVAGAPKMGDKASWTERYKKGWETLLSHAVNGYKGMPARGHCVKCSDKEIGESINYILNNSNVERTE